MVVQHLKSIDEGPFQMGTFRETLAEGTKGALHLGPERPRVYSSLSPKDKERTYGTNVDDATWKQHEAHANENKMMLDRFTQHTVDLLVLMSNVSHPQYHSLSSTTPPSMYVPPHFADNSQLDSGLSTRVDRIEDMVTMHGVQVQLVMGELRTESGMLIQVKHTAGVKVLQLAWYRPHENGVALDEEQLLFLANVEMKTLCMTVDAFDFDVDEAPTVQTMIMANLSSAYPVYDEAGPSYDSDILSEVHDHDQYQDTICEHHEEHEMHDDVQPNYVVDSHADYTSDSNMILYDQYVKDNSVPVVQSNVSSVPNDAYMMIYNDMYEPHAQSVSKTTRNTVVDNSLMLELDYLKEQVELI
ncbi:hypothetical protein Tco_0530321 [Tanacetum coccineum]